jgi:hypothetical protein
MTRIEIIDEGANIPPDAWEKVLRSMKDNLDEGALITFSTEKTESWVYRLWMEVSR